MKKRFSMVCLMLMLSTVPMLQSQPNESPTMLVSECEKALNELKQTSLDELTKLESEYDLQLKKLGDEYAKALSVATVAAVAEASRPLLVEIAGLKAQRNQRIWWGLCGVGIGLLAGLIVALLS